LHFPSPNQVRAASLLSFLFFLSFRTPFLAVLFCSLSLLVSLIFALMSAAAKPALKYQRYTARASAVLRGDAVELAARYATQSLTQQLDCNVSFINYATLADGSGVSYFVFVIC
jgi:hypothetical protein